MRIKTPAKAFKAGMLAFLPYYMKLRKAKITTVAPVGEYITVYYRLLSESNPLRNNLCVMKPTSEYEVYVRPRKAKSNG